MGDLIEFLRERLDEEEATAVEAGPAPWCWSGLDGDYPTLDSGTDACILTAWVHGDDGGIVVERPDAAHIAYWDPARVLAEVAAKRAIIDGLSVFESRLDLDGEPVGMIRTLTGRAYRLATLTLAQVYAEHPDFDPAWHSGE